MCKVSAGQAGRKEIGWRGIVRLVLKEGRREVLIGRLAPGGKVLAAGRLRFAL